MRVVDLSFAKRVEKEVRAIDGGQILKGFAFTIRNLKIILKAMGMIVDATEESNIIELLFLKKNKLNLEGEEWIEMGQYWSQGN